MLRSIFNLLRFNRRNWKAVALCLFAATVFWFFNALNKRYTTNISFPVNFEYDEEQYIAVRPLPEQVRINVTGMGWDLFRRSVGVKVPPLVIPLEHPSDIKKIVAMPALFANQLERFQINFIISDTLRLALEPRITRRISLRLDSPSILFRSGYIMTSEPKITPDSIEVEGPEQLIESLQEPFYLKLTQRNIDGNFKEDVEVRFLNNELVKRDPPTVSVAFEVDKLVEVTDSIKLDVINYPRGARPSFGVRRVPFTFRMPKRSVKSYHRDSVRAVLDLKHFSRGVKKLLPTVEGLPPHTVIAAADSVVVRF